MNHTIDRGFRRGRARGCAATTAVLALLAVALAAPARAQEVRERVEDTPIDVRLVLPLELGQGPRFDGIDGGFAWRGQANFLPGARFGGFELSGLLSAVYAGSEGDALIGARASHVLVGFLQGTVALRMAVQGAFSFRTKNADGAAGAVLDLASILRLGAWAGCDFEEPRYYALITVGFDVLTLGDPVGAIVKAGPMEDVGDGR